MFNQAMAEKGALPINLVRICFCLFISFRHTLRYPKVCESEGVAEDEGKLTKEFGWRYHPIKSPNGYLCDIFFWGEGLPPSSTV